MYTKDDRTLAGDQFQAIMEQLQRIDIVDTYRNEVIGLRIKVAKLQAKVDLYEKYISHCIDHDSAEIGDVCSFNGELYRMVSREDKHDMDSVKTVCCEFHCAEPKLPKENFKK